MTVAYKTFIQIGDFKRLYRYHEEKVLGLAFTQGSMYYFKKDRFNYLTVGDDSLIATRDDNKVTVYTKRDSDLAQYKWA